MVFLRAPIVPHSSVGMQRVTLCVTDLRRATCSRQDAERPERHTHAEHGHDGVLADTCEAVQSISLMTCSEGSRDLPAFSSSCK